MAPLWPPRGPQPLTTVHRITPGGGPVEQRVDFFRTARRWSGEPVVAEPATNAGFRWCALHRLPEPVQPQEAQVLSWLRFGLCSAADPAGRGARGRSVACTP